MTTHPTAEARARYLRGTLAADELLEVDEHLAACEECRAAAPSMSRAAASMSDAIAGEHLDYEQIEAYVDGTLDDPAAAKAHLEVCELCAGEVEDLRGAAHVSPSRGWMWSAATAAALTLVILGVIALRRPKPAPSAPEQPQVVQTAPAQQQQPRVEPVRPEDPSAKLSPSLARTLEQLSEGVIASAALVADLRGSTESVRGREETDGELTVLEPLGVVEDTRPQFRWTTRRDATYVVEVFDASYARVITSDAIRGNRWRPAKALARGVTHSWQVSETRGDEKRTAPMPPAPPARFRIIDAKSARELEGASHLAAALIYTREGVLDRALEEMTRAQAEHPDSPAIAKALETLRKR